MRPARSAFAACFSLSLLLASGFTAQAEPPAPQHPAGRPAPSKPGGAPGSPAPAGAPAPNDPAAAGPDLERLRDSVAAQDPMLAPPPPAAHVLADFGMALEMIRNRSTDLRIALEEVQRSEGLWREALAGALPNITATGNVTANLIRGTVTGVDLTTGQLTTTRVPDAITYGAGVTLTQPLIAPRTWYSVGTARQAITNARLSLDDQKRLIMTGLANAIVAVVTAERVSELDRIGLSAALERLVLTRRRMALGAANALDVVRTEQDVEVARAAIVTSDESLRQARESLGLALGVPEPWGVRPDINLDVLEAGARGACPEGSLEQRADIAAARGAVEVARRNVNDVTLQYLPTLNLVSSLNATSVRLGNNLHETWTIAGVLTVPIWDGGVRSGEMIDTRAQLDESIQRLEAARRTAIIQIEQARRGVEVADAAAQVARRARDLARETERLSRFAFQAGTGTSLDLVESGRRLREAESELALKEFDLVRARIASFLAVAQCVW